MFENVISLFGSGETGTGAFPRLEPLEDRSTPAAMSSGAQAGAAGQNQNAAFAAADPAFVTASVQSNLLEIQMGLLAASRGSTAAVREFGQHLVNEHVNALVQEVPLMGQAGVGLSLASYHVQLATTLASLSGTAFDQTFLAASVVSHQMSIVLFQTEAAGGTNTAARAYAQAQLPHLQEHLQTTLSLFQQVLTSGSQTQTGTSGQGQSS